MDRPVSWNDQNYAAFAASAAVKDEVAFSDDTTIFVGGSTGVSLLHDSTVPTLSSATINASGNKLTLAFSEPIQFSLPITLTVASGNFTLGLLTLDKTNTNINNIVLNLNRTILSGETLTITAAAGFALDNANNAVTAESGSAVTNSSTQTTTTTTTTT